MKSSIDGSIEIDVPAGTAYLFWTRIEDFPKFIAPIEAVHLPRHAVPLYGPPVH